MAKTHLYVSSLWAGGLECFYEAERVNVLTEGMSCSHAALRVGLTEA